MQDLITIIHDTIDDVHKWYWLEKDHGAWDGPKNDWISSHKHEYFKSVKNYDVVVQAGGCLGMYPRLLSDMFRMVYTFEPDPLNFYCLNLNCQKKNIVKFNCALGEESKMISLLQRSETNVGMHTVIADDNRQGIPMLRLDDIGLEACDLICLDVEGHEGRVLLGATHTICRFNPVIICENGHDIVASILEPYGYKAQGQSVSDVIYVRQ